jgi:hypothetical protein
MSPREARCRQATLLAEDHSGRGEEWRVNSKVLPAAPAEGESVLLVAAQAQGRSAGTETAEARRQREPVSVPSLFGSNDHGQ